MTVAQIPVELMNDPTLDAVDFATEVAEARPRYPRSVGMGSIDACARKNWYRFHYAAAPAGFEARTIYLLEDGHHGEDEMAKRLKRVPGIELHTRDPATGKQLHVTDMGGHVQGYLDGLIKGLKQAPQTWHVWEHKQSTKGAELDKLKVSHGEKAALKEWNINYYNQATFYMGLRGLKRHYLTCSSPGGRQTTSVRTNFDPDYFASLRTTVHQVITSNVPLAKISEKASFYQCKWCDYSPICHGESLPEPTCRSCLHFAVSLDGDRAAGCMWHRHARTLEEQAAGCHDHRYQPSLVTFASASDADAAGNTVTYTVDADDRTFINGNGGEPGNYLSYELQAMPLNRISNPQGDDIREEFDAVWKKS